MSARRGELFRQERAAIEDFLQNFLVSDEATKEATTKYVAQLQRIANRKSESLVVSLDDLESYTDVPVCVDMRCYALLRVDIRRCDPLVPWLLLAHVFRVPVSLLSRSWFRISSRTRTSTCPSSPMPRMR